MIDSEPALSPTHGHTCACASTPSRRCVFLAAGLLVLAAGLAYSNSFQGQFYFDDAVTILHNRNIRSLWPISRVVAYVPEQPNAGRPLVSISLAMNYAISRTQAWSYHAFNLLVHILAGLTLLGIVRRTLLSDRMKDRFGRHATLLAGLTALLWTVHPLQTESVTYIVQRAEAMVGLFYLLTLYCFLRSSEAGSRRRLWTLGATLSCAAGMATKEVMVTAPVMILLYDRVFLSKSWKEPFRSRWPMYLCLAGTWAILLALMAESPRSTTAGFNMPYLSPWQYLTAQFGVVLHYLRLCFWPHPLILDYGLGLPENAWEIVLPGIVLVLLLAAALWALWKAPAAGFCGAWFFVILSPTSSIVPIMDLCFEHRVYLSLAGVIALVVCGLYALVDFLLRRRPALASMSHRLGMAGLILAGAIAAVLATVTFLRNEDYCDPMRMNLHAVQYRPDNARAIYNLGNAYYARDDVDKAIELYHQALALNPMYAGVYDNLGMALGRKGRYNEAYEAFDKSFSAYRYEPSLFSKIGRSEVNYHYGCTLEAQGRPREAVERFRNSLELDPSSPEKWTALGGALTRSGRPDEAVEAFRRSLQQDDRNAVAYFGLGDALLAQNKPEEAAECFRKACELNPKVAEPCNRLGETLVHLGKPTEAAEEFRRAIRLKEKFPEPHYSLALLAAGRRDWPEAEKEFRRVVELAPNYAPARTGLGLALARQNRPAEAIGQYREAVKLSETPVALNQLAWLLATCADDRVRNGVEAETFARKACEMTGNKVPTLLDTLAAAQAARGDFAKAAATAESALILAKQGKNAPLVEEISARLELYKAKKPYRNPS
jgi:tetratricopeptide (TPR) repeat protein